MLIDAHTHLTPQQVRHKDLLPENMLLLVNTATAQEAQWLFGMREPSFVPTVGLHPWEAGRHGLEELVPFWERCAAIGEIGLDSMWCDVPAARQEEVFCRQLDLAQRLQKPVILHVKGCEQRAAHLLSCFSMPKLVH